MASVIPIRQVRNLRPVRTKRRTVIQSFVVLAFMAFLASSWFSQSIKTNIDLGNPDVVVISSDAGPVKVVEASSAKLEMGQSWLLRSPSHQVARDGKRVEVNISCPLATPCRVVSELSLPSGTALEVRGGGGVVSVESFSGDLRVTASKGDVVLGQVEGSAVIESAGAVNGFSLALDRAEVAAEGEVDLAFRLAPEAVNVEAGTSRVKLDLPAVLYAADVESSGPKRIDIDRKSSAARSSPARSISVRSEGEVTVETAS